MRAGVFRGIRDIDVQSVPDPQAGPNDIVVQVAACGICGSDLHTYTHGSFVEPGQIMGHEFAGEVVQVGAAIEGVRQGDRVTAVPLHACGRCPRCLEGKPNLCEVGLAQSIAYGLPGGFAEYVKVPNAVVGGNVFRLPEEVSSRDGALVEPMAVGLHTARLAAPRPDDVAVVIGLGSIGQNVVQGLRVAGVAHIIGVDVSDVRLETASTLGAHTVLNGQEADVLDEIIRLTGAGAYGVGARADIVVECSGVPRMLGQAVEMVRHAGKVLVTALYDDPVPIDGTMIVQKELSLQGCFAYHGEFPTAIELLRSKRAQADPLVSHEISLEQIDDAFQVQMDANRSVKVLVTP